MPIFLVAALVSFAVSAFAEKPRQPPVTQPQPMPGGGGVARIPPTSTWKLVTFDAQIDVAHWMTGPAGNPVIAPTPFLKHDFSGLIYGCGFFPEPPVTAVANAYLATITPATFDAGDQAKLDSYSVKVVRRDTGEPCLTPGQTQGLKFQGNSQCHAAGDNPGTVAVPFNNVCAYGAAHASYLKAFCAEPLHTIEEFGPQPWDSFFFARPATITGDQGRCDL